MFQIFMFLVLGGIGIFLVMATKNSKYKQATLWILLTLVVLFVTYGFRALMFM